MTPPPSAPAGLFDPEGPDEVRSALYDGAGGIVWALRHLEALGFGVGASQRFDAAIDGFIDRNRAADRIRQALDFNSYLLGDSGLLLLQHRARPDPGVPGEPQSISSAGWCRLLSTA